eukprot:934222_1
MDKRIKLTAELLEMSVRKTNDLSKRLATVESSSTNIQNAIQSLEKYVVHENSKNTQKISNLSESLKNLGDTLHSQVGTESEKFNAVLTEIQTRMSELETGLESSKITINRKLEGYRASIDKLHAVAKCNTSQLDKLGSQHSSLDNTVGDVTSRIDSLSQ